MTERTGIIGGIVGSALARALAQTGIGEVTVLEKEHRLPAHQTGHNSGVVHAGLYYAEGSLKARLCVAGREALRDFCQEKNLPYREAGKLVVAADETELPALAEIERRSRAERGARPGPGRPGRGRDHPAGAGGGVDGCVGEHRAGGGGGIGARLRPDDRLRRPAA